MKIKYSILAFFIFLLLTQAGCSIIPDPSSMKDSLDEQLSSKDTSSGETAIMIKFDTLLSDDATNINSLYGFVKAKISSVSKPNASILITGLEDFQIKQLSALEKEYNNKNIQEKCNKLKLRASDFNQPENIKDSTIQSLALKTKTQGYRVSQPGKKFIPVINYSFYKDFNFYATPDIQNYVKIMELECNNPIVANDSLSISWEELISRILTLEKYLAAYPDSKKAEAIRVLYKQYEFVTMYGATNTPLFDPKTNMIITSAKATYENALAKDSDSLFLKDLRKFMDVVKMNNYKLTVKVEDYRMSNANGHNASDSNRYAVAGIVAATEFEQTYRQLQDMVKKGDKKTFSEYIAYPITVTIKKKKVEIKNQDEFIKNYNKIITKAVKSAFLKQKVEKAVVNTQGVMVGEGNLWFAQFSDKTHRYCIYAINN